MMINRLNGINNAAIALPPVAGNQNTSSNASIALHPGTGVPNNSIQEQSQYRIDQVQAISPSAATHAIQANTAQRSASIPDTERLDAIRAEQRQWVEGMQQVMRQLNNQLTGFALSNAQQDNMGVNLFDMAGMSRIPGAAGMQSYFNMFTRDAAGNFSVDLSGVSPEVRDQLISRAQEDVSDNGFWGVSRTSERIFSFAEALTGGDPARMERMQQVVERAFERVGRAFGGFDNMPEISRETHAALMQRFEDFLAAAGNAQTADLMGTA